ncbi:MAG TPA: hypothetical protein VF212_01250 [Longimicrobiales bacterium]
MRRGRRWTGSMGVAVALALLGAGAARAQDDAGRARLSGRVVDAEGRPVPGVAVSVHRVSRAGGAELARTTVGPDGRFELTFDAEGEGTYFAATRYEGGLYVGAMFRDPGEAPADYVITVGRDPVAVAAGPATTGSAAPPPAPNPWPLLLLVGAIGAAAVVLPLASWRRRPRALRALLHELAELEERGADPALSPGEYEAERAALRGRIRELTRTAG